MTIKFVLITTAFVSAPAMAKSFPQLTPEAVSDYISKSNACEFAWGFVYREPKTAAEKMEMQFPPKKVGYLLQTYSGSWSNGTSSNYRTEVYCIFNGDYGQGIRKQSGCVAGRHDVDNDLYGEFLVKTVFSSTVVASGFIAKPCSKSVIEDLLFNTEIGGTAAYGTGSTKGALKSSEELMLGGRALEIKVLVNKPGIQIPRKTPSQAASPQRK